MKSTYKNVRENLKSARAIWGHLPRTVLRELEELTRRYCLSVVLGDVQRIQDRWYVTSSGLLRLAARRGCKGIGVSRVRSLCDPAAGRWVFKSTVYKSADSKGFVGHGDADPFNVSPLVRGAEMRVAETRAVNRALRKAYGIGLCSVEELGWEPRSNNTSGSQKSASAPNNNGHEHGHIRLRDRLCLLIREHQLDPALVKAYAADYCGTPALHNASREQVETFINHLTARATKDRAALLCHLNSFAKAQEVSS